jgi:uncharacterized membrane protein
MRDRQRDVTVVVVVLLLIFILFLFLFCFIVSKHTLFSGFATCSAQLLRTILCLDKDVNFTHTSFTMKHHIVSLLKKE